MSPNFRENEAAVLSMKFRIYFSIALFGRDPCTKTWHSGAFASALCLHTDLTLDTATPYNCTMNPHSFLFPFITLA